MALRVNLALMATRPVIGNYFNGALEGLMGSLGIKIHEDEDPPRSTQEGLEKSLAKELVQLSVSASSLEGCESCGLHVGYSLQYTDPGKGPSVPALSSMVLPDLLDVINCLRLGISTPLDKDQSSEEQQDLLESLVAKGVPRSSKTKDVYQKLVNILAHNPASGIQHLFQNRKWIHRCLQGRQILLRNQLWGTQLPTQEPRWALTGFREGFPFHLFLTRGPNLVRRNWQAETPTG